MKKYFLLVMLLLSVFVLSDSTSSSEVQAQTRGPDITNYHVPCGYGVLTDISTNHPYYGTRTYTDTRRRSYDIQCYDESGTRFAVSDVFSPTGGVVYNTRPDLPQYERYITIQDSVNNACLYVVHVGEIFVMPGQTVTTGTLLGRYASSAAHVHLTAFDGSCGTGAFVDPYDERPISFIEVGSPLDGNTPYSAAPSKFRSQNLYTPLVTNLAWNFSQGVPQGWIAAHQLTGVTQLDGGMWAQVTGSDPQFLSPTLAPFNATDYDRLEIRMGTQSARCIEFFWRGPHQGWDGARRIVYDLPNNGDTFTIPLNTVSSWTGIIEQFRFDPACRLGNPPNAVRIDSIRLLRAADSGTAMRNINWDFGLRIPQLWTPANGLEGVTQRDGGMWARVIGDDPVYLSPVMQPFPASNFNQLYFEIGTMEAQCIEFKWRRPGQAFLDVVTMDINRIGAYTIELTPSMGWSGQIEQIRFDPACRADPLGDSNGYGVRVDTIQLRTATTVETPEFELILEPATTTVGIGESIPLTVFMSNPDLAPNGGIRGLDIACTIANPVVISGVGSTNGTELPASAFSVMLPDPSFPSEPDFQWLMTVPDSEANITSSMTVLDVSYAATAEGITTVNCVAEALDGAGNLITSVPINTATIEVLGNGSISGIVTLERTTDYSGINVRILDTSGSVAATTTTDATGAFSATLPPGYYTVEADTEGYIGALTEEFQIVFGSAMDIGTVELLAGDVNSDHLVDLLDVTQFAADYNQPPTNNVDFDRNGETDLRDFAALVTNIDATGPISWGGGEH